MLGTWSEMAVWGLAHCPTGTYSEWYVRHRQSPAQRGGPIVEDSSRGAPGSVLVEGNVAGARTQTLGR